MCKINRCTFSKILEDAIGSAFEIESQLLITGKVYDTLKERAEKIFPLINEVQKMLNSLIEKLKSNRTNG